MISQMPFECFPLLSVPAMSQPWLCVVRQSGAGLSLGNTIRSARAIFKCPLLVIPYVIAGISPLSFPPNIPPGLSAGIGVLWCPGSSCSPTPPRTSRPAPLPGSAAKSLARSLIPFLLQPGRPRELSAWPSLLPTCQLIFLSAVQQQQAAAAEGARSGYAHGFLLSPLPFAFQPILVKIQMWEISA